jgi:hypothetical protein
MDTNQEFVTIQCRVCKKEIRVLAKRKDHAEHAYATCPDCSDD